MTDQKIQQTVTYRPDVGIVLLNKRVKPFAGRRADKEDARQMP